MQLLDVRADHLELVQRILQQHVPDAEVWAFGSRAKWLARDSSDLDLCIRAAAALSFEQMGLLREAFEESNLPYKVDVVDWTMASAAFREIIERDRVVVWEGRSSTKGAAGEWGELPFSEAVLLNPVTPLVKGVIYPFVEMSAIAAGTRDVKCSEYRNFSGGGSRFQDRDTLMARITPCLENGKLARFQAPEGEPIGHGSTEFIVIRGKPNVTDNDYAYYLAISPEVRKFAISQMTGTSGRQRVPTDALGKISVLLPPLTEQKAIAHILGTLDNKIALNRRMNATLEAIAQALFKSWFVDFDPVRAKMEGRAPEGMDEATAALFPDALDDDEKPQGWSNGTLGDLAVLNPESWSKKSAPAEIEYVDLTNTKWGTIEMTTRFAWADAPSRAQRIIRPGDTIVGTVRPGNSSYSYVSANGLTGSTGFAVLRPKEDQNRELLYLAATSSENIKRLSYLADGGAYPAVRPEVVLASPIVLPDSKLVAAFSGIVASLIKAIEQNKHEAATLASLHDLLLPKLLSGEIRIKDAEHIAGAAP
ncbi:restriction endonuclease subunit S [Verminephrobacter eiseniae]|uniref:restriction endonuclease subunit S n=1 Tax=Verminephrobacter eiseniae TaxID=364317 RepID=UPI00223830C9|nr:restriction endonuclease subunit S [Verminephrobacter eiseniae]